MRLDENKHSKSVVPILQDSGFSRFEKKKLSKRNLGGTQEFSKRKVAVQQVCVQPTGCNKPFVQPRLIHRVLLTVRGGRFTLSEG